MGGAIQAIDRGYIQKEIQNSSYVFQKEIESRERTYVGINKYTADDRDGVNILRVDPKQVEIEADKLRKLRLQRDQASWRSSLDNLERVTGAGENVFPAILSAVKARATVGEICDVWRKIFGEYRPKEFI